MQQFWSICEITVPKAAENFLPILDQLEMCFRACFNSSAEEHFAEELEEKFSVPIIVEHDPNCILYGCIKKNGGSKMVVRLDMSRRSARSQTVVKR